MSYGDRAEVHGNSGNMAVGGQGNRVGNITVNSSPPASPSTNRAAGPAGRSHRLGFVVDVVSYGERSAPAQERIQGRLQSLLRGVVADVGADFDEVDHDGGSGDGMVVFLPSGGDPTRLLPGLLRATAERLAEDNETYRDRVRLRMAVGSGLVGEGATGFSGPLVVNISRLVDSQPLRRAVADNPDSDLVVLVLDALHREVVVPGYLAPRVAQFRLVDVAMKEFIEPAWLWVSTPGDQGR
ncbi:hypothetical protein [Actinophytocola sp.]|uniref:hypothetical protein n=1 Tax=Actinophytocola sp. TaxID=1872138 RepID=UPI003D6C2BF8